MSNFRQAPKLYHSEKKEKGIFYQLPQRLMDCVFNQLSGREGNQIKLISVLLGTAGDGSFAVSEKYICDRTGMDQSSYSRARKALVDKGWLKMEKGSLCVDIKAIQSKSEKTASSHPAHSGRSNYARDYKVMGKLKKFADAHGICLLIVHHTRKSKDKDPFNMISGSAGLLGCVDGAFMLLKNSRMDDGAVLDVIGRDQPEQQIYLCRDDATLVWNFEGELKEEWIEPADPILDALNEMLTDEEPKWTGSASELIQLLALGIQPNALTKKLNVKAGKLLNDYCIRYENIHTRNGSRISLTRQHEEAPA